MHVEDVVSVFEGIQPAQNGVWSVKELHRDRLYATRSADGAFGIFIIGEVEGFGSIPRSSSVSHSADVRIQPEGRTLAALRVLAPSTVYGNRALVFFAYEACELLSRNGELSNEHLLNRLIWMLGLFGGPEMIMTPERQRGLVAELHLLARLVRFAHSKGRPGMAALRNWHGSSPAKRDFACTGIAVEVKATNHDARIHSISSIEQLNPADVNETVYVYSIGVRHDYSAPRKLKHFVEDVEVLLTLDELQEFHNQLSHYGFDASHREIYDSQPGIAPFHLQPAFFAEHGMTRLRDESFVGGSPPDSVLSVAYKLLITSDPVPVQHEADILSRLLA
jgi:hypothetical protein